MSQGELTTGQDDPSSSDGFDASVGHWCHRPEALVKGCCNYSVQVSLLRIFSFFYFAFTCHCNCF